MGAHVIGGLEVVGPPVAGWDEMLTPAAGAFVRELCVRFEPRRQELLARRRERQREIDAGRLPHFLPETAHVRRAEWRVAPRPADLADRRVEVTGPPDRATAEAALRSGAQAWMADGEDALSPTWENVIGAQRVLHEAIRGRIVAAPEANRVPLTIWMRPRGWHLDEKHVRLDGRRVSATLFEWGVYFFHNALELVARGSGPYFYLPKLESHLEARLWNDVFGYAQAALGIPRGTIRATAMIETILAAFEAEEILSELREHAAGLNCGRWDYIFSVIKKLRNRPEYLFPDRGEITMTVPFMRAYTRHVVAVCRRRGAQAMGGSATQIPIPGDEVANAAALAKVRADKLREVGDGFAGTWVGHPGLVQTALEAFASGRGGEAAAGRAADVAPVTASDLLAPLTGPITESGVRRNLHVGVHYIEAWLRGAGADPIDNVLEELATAEISRAQLWQWRKFGASQADGRRVTSAWYAQLLDEELAAIRRIYGEARFAAGRFPEARDLFMRLVNSDQFEEFLSVPAYELLE